MKSWWKNRIFLSSLQAWGLSGVLMVLGLPVVGISGVESSPQSLQEDTTRVAPMVIPDVVLVPADVSGRGGGVGDGSSRENGTGLSGSARWDSLQAAQERVQREVDGLEEAESAGAQERLEEMEALADSPVQINRASADALAAIPGLSATLAQAVVAYREAEHPFRTVDELLEVRGIGPATLASVRPFVTVGSVREQREDLWLNPSLWVHDGRWEMISRWNRPVELAQGYRDGSFVGGPEAQYQRLVFRSDHLSAGTILNKRSGEPWAGWRSPESMPLYVSMEDLGRLRTLVVGDFRAGFGQGLVLGGGSTFGKGADVIGSASRSGGGVRGHTSSRSSHGFRGVGVTVGSRPGEVGSGRSGGSGGSGVESSQQATQERWLDHWSLTLFGSRKPRSASVVSDSIRIPSGSPSYRLPSGVARRNNVTQSTGGARMEVSVSSVQLGINWLGNRWDRPVAESTDPWQQHRPEGRGVQVGSADVRMGLPGASLSGEVARSGKGAWALLSAIELMAGEQTRWILSWRDYQPGFQSLFGDAFGEQSGAPRNERGLYAGVDHRFGPDLRMRGYLDLFSFPGPRFFTRQPSHGHEWLGRLDWEPRSGQEWQLQVRQKVRGEEFLGQDRWGEPIRLLAPERRWRARIQVSQELEHGMRLRARLEQVVARPAGGAGRPPCSDPDALADWQENGLWCDGAEGSGGGSGSSGSGSGGSGSGSGSGTNSTVGAGSESGSTRRGPSRGWGGWIDFRVPMGRSLRLDMRVTTFRTDDFDARIYAVESDLLYRFASQMLYGRGERIYLMASWTPLPEVQIQGKIATTVLREEREASDPRMQIEGRRRSDIGIQVRVKL